MQWDFDCGERLSSTPGCSVIGSKKKELAFEAQYGFPGAESFRIACKVRDDMGGEGMWSGEIWVE